MKRLEGLKMFALQESKEIQIQSKVQLHKHSFNIMYSANMTLFHTNTSICLLVCDYCVTDRSTESVSETGN